MLSGCPKTCANKPTMRRSLDADFRLALGICKRLMPAIWLPYGLGFHELE